MVTCPLESLATSLARHLFRQYLGHLLSWHLGSLHEIRLENFQEEILLGPVYSQVLTLLCDINKFF